MNHDLIGFAFTGDDGQEWTVTGTPAWAEGGAYVVCEAPNGKQSCRRVSDLRRARELTPEAECCAV